MEEYCSHCGRELHHDCPKCGGDMHHCEHCHHDHHGHVDLNHRPRPVLPMEPMVKNHYMSKEVKIGIIVISAIFVATAIDIMARKYLD